jgi:hypothetical protein
VIAYTFSVETFIKSSRVMSRAVYFDRKSSELNLYIKTHINNIEFFNEFLDTMMNVFILTRV